jgi:hypothetical protein
MKNGTMASGFTMASRVISGLRSISGLRVLQARTLAHALQASVVSCKNDALEQVPPAVRLHG